MIPAAIKNFKITPEQKATGKKIITGAAILTGGIILFTQYKKIKDYLEALSSYSQSQQEYTTTGGETFEVGTIAAEVYQKIYHNDIFGATEDDEGIYDLLKNLEPDVIAKVGQSYFKQFTKVLKVDLINYLNDEYWNQIKDKF